MHRIVLIALLAVGLSVGPATAQEPGPASLRWMALLDKAVPGSPPGKAAILGPQPAIRLNVAFSNFEGPAIEGLLALPDLLSVDVRRDGQPATVRTTIVLLDSPGPLLAPGESLTIAITVAPDTGDTLGFGTYAIEIDANRALSTLRTETGDPWKGRAKRSETRTVLLRPAVTQADRIQYLRIEGNYRLGHRDPAGAAVLLDELTRLAPRDWQAAGALGAALYSSKRYAEAASVLERTLPQALQVDERQGRFVSNTLASAYLALGRRSDAVRVLRDAGVPDAEVSNRLLRLSPR